MRPSRVSRLVRGVLAASIATFVALVSHVTGGGPVPGWIGVAVPLIGSVLVCTALAGRRLSLVRLSLAVASSQVMFHALFVLGTYAPGSAPTPRHDHGHGSGAAMAMAPAGESMAGSGSAAIWVAHALAAVLTVAVLHRGERTLMRLRELSAQLVGWVRRRILIPLTSPSLVVARDSRPAVFSTLPVMSERTFAAHRRRGPPVVGTV